MLPLHDSDTALLLDECLVLMMNGEPWEQLVPADSARRGEMQLLMGVAEELLRQARSCPKADPERRRRIWNRANGVRGTIRRIAFYRLPYLPPLWIRPEAHPEAC